MGNDFQQVMNKDRTLEATPRILYALLDVLFTKGVLAPNDLITALSNLDKGKALLSERFKK
jgi:hypothetical protein